MVALTVAFVASAVAFAVAFAACAAFWVALAEDLRRLLCGLCCLLCGLNRCLRGRLCSFHAFFRCLDRPSAVVFTVFSAFLTVVLIVFFPCCLVFISEFAAVW